MRGPVRRFFSDRASIWDQRTGAGSVAHLEPLAAAVLHVSPAPERILDIGCGTGEGTLFLSREFPQARVRGVDLSEEMIHAAVAKVGLDPEGRIAFKVGDASSLPYAEDSFDLVTMLNMPPFFAEVGAGPAARRPGDRRLEPGTGDRVLHPALAPALEVPPAGDRAGRDRRGRRRDVLCRPPSRALSREPRE